MIQVALENVRSLQNIGAIIRTCSFFGVQKLILLGYSGKTKDTKNRTIMHPDILKTALGAEKDVEIIFIDSAKDLKKYSQNIIAIEQHEKSIDLKTIDLKDCVLVFGNEVDGASQEILNASKQIVEIERLGNHNSLNIATAVGIVLYKATSSLS